MRACRLRSRHAVLSLVTVAAAIIGFMPAASAEAAPGPRFGENYLLPPVSSGRARDVPGLAVDPADQDHIVEAEIDPINLQCDYHVSFDGGRTWAGGHLTVHMGGENPPFPTPACNQNFDSGGYGHFNTGIVFGSGQNVYITFSAHRGQFNRPESGEHGGDGDDGVVAHSTDGGRTYQPAVVAIPGGGSVLASPNLAGFGMRPGLAVQRGAGAGGKDRLYVASWNCFTEDGCSGGTRFARRIYVARSDDGGATWTAPVLASQPNVRTGADVTTAGTADEQTREPSQPVVGPDGAIYVAYRNRDVTNGTSSCPGNPNYSGQKRNCIVVARSTNLGQTWQQFSTNVPLNGFVGHPRLAVDPATPANVGTLYITFQGPDENDPDVVVQRSTDRAQTWSPTVKVNDDTSGALQDNPWVSVGPGGRVDVIWGDWRHAYPDNGNMLDIYYARSTNGGVSFGQNHRVTDRTINASVGRMGDYGSYIWYGPVSLPLADGSILSAWTDSREGSFDTAFQDIYLSRLNPSAPIASRTIATATPPGLSVRLSRLAYPGGSEALSTLTPATRVVVANKDDVAGALAGSVLARANWAPLLLSPAGGLPAIVKAESARMRPEGAYVIGSTSTLSTAVSGALTDTTRNRENVTRVAPSLDTEVPDRAAETARRIAELLRPLPGAAEAVIANPKTPEAAAAASLAAALKLPILFVDERTTIPAPTSRAIASLGIKKLLIVGGTGSVNATVASALGTAVGAANIKRLGGATPSEVGESVLAEARSRGLPSNVLYVADGARPVEVAALGAAVARLNGLVLLTAGASTSVAETRAQALGFDTDVDRIVGAIGTGGTDPAVPTAAPKPPGGGALSLLPPANLAMAGCPGAASSKNLIVLTNGSDARNGTARADRLFAGGGNDVVDALAGDDCVDLGPGNDRGQGGLGADFIQGGLGEDTVGGGAGGDRLRGFLGNDRLTGNSGNDVIAGGSGRDRLAGGSGNDSLRGDSGRDRVAGGAGRDRITGGSGRDAISGGSGADRISALDGVRDRINCGSGRDRVTADRVDRVSHNCERVRRR
jgi:putative cell wall-binding protein